MIFPGRIIRVECGLKARRRVCTCPVFCVIDSVATCLGLQKSGIDPCSAAGCFTGRLLLGLRL